MLVTILLEKIVSTCKNHSKIVRIEENGSGGNSKMIHLMHCKNFCKCHNVPPPSTTIKRKKRIKLHVLKCKKKENE
jgi:hypothetical protein